MKIVENTDRRLVIVHRPWVMAGLIWTMGLAALYGAITGKQIHSLAEHVLVAALGLGVTFAAWYWFAFLRITFDRDTGQVEHRALRPFGTRRKFLDLDRVRGARIEANWSENARLTRLALDTEDGVAALEYGFGSGDRAALETAINEWLTRPG
ncbi:MAG: hypothetical protein ACTSUD_08940 [Alphaproteobacteria bacterium]